MAYNYANTFAEKIWVAFAFAKATHIFFSKITCKLDIEQLTFRPLMSLLS